MSNRLLVVCGAFPFYSETFVVREVAALLASGWDVHVACQRSDPQQWAHFEDRFPHRDFADRVHVSGDVRQPLRRLRPSLVHFQFGYLTAGSAVWTETPARVLVSFRGSDINVVGVDEPGFYDTVWRRADALHFVHERLWARARARGCPASMPHFIIPSSVDTGVFDVGGRDEGERGSEERPLRILSVGRIHWIKAYPDGLQAVRRVVDQGVHCIYRIMGSSGYPEAERELRYWIHRLDLERVVEIVGAGPQDAVVAQLRWADVLLHPSIAEGFCNASLEAQATGLPVVGTEALEGNVVDGETGFIVPAAAPDLMAERLVALGRSPQLRLALGEKGRARASGHFAPDTQIGQLDAMYRTVLAGADDPEPVPRAGPRVAVVIPCYDLGEYLPEAVDSVRAQTCADWELVIVNDGSTDPPTLDLLARYEREGVRVLHTENRGASAARNHGIAHTSSEYVLCLDADDVLQPSFLQQTVATLDAQPDAGIAATEVEFFGEEVSTWTPTSYAPATLLWRNCIPSCSLFRRVCWEQTGGYRDLKACQDWDLWISIVVEQGWKWTVVPERLYRYRRRRNSISEFREANRGEVLRAMLSHHTAAYADRSTEVFIEMDAALQRSTREVQKLRRQPPPASLEVLRTQLEHAELVARLGRTIRDGLPGKAVVGVVSHGDAALLRVGPDQRGRHVPESADGQYAGHHPADSQDAIARFEAQRQTRLDFLVIPRTSFWWLEHYAGFAEHLALRYREALRNDDCVIFDVSTELPVHTFSVVICTYKRAAFLGAAIDSVFAQQYPRDAYEVIVIDNDSPDETQQVVRDRVPKATVPFACHVETRNGLSYARNLGIAQSRHEYVAFLDDDAVACPQWLQTFNRVINAHHALVVGSRIEKVFVPAGAPPDWWPFQYVMHFFGVNYRDRGRREPMFRIRHPLYLTGASIAYARRLFDVFPQFDPRLGRDAKSLLAGEESLLNGILDRHDVPMYYSDEAWVDHYIEASRVTKPHLRRKAYWSGVTNGVMHPMIFGFEQTRRRVPSAWREVRQRIAEIVLHRGSPENFARELRIINNLAFLATFYPRDLRHRLRGRRDRLPRFLWEEQWPAEVASWPDSEEKFLTLQHACLRQADIAGAEAAAARLNALRETYGVPRDPSVLGWSTAFEKIDYELLVARSRRWLAEHLPRGARVLVVSRGDEALLRLDPAEAGHFPQARNGEYAGHYPANDAAAIEHLESLVARGFDHLFFPETSLWWLDHYRGLCSHLADRHRRVDGEPGVGALFALRTEGASTGVHRVVREARP